MTVMAQLELHFTCYHAWKVPESERLLYVTGIGCGVRGLVTVGQIKLDSTFLDLLPKLEIVAINSVGIEMIDLNELKRRGILATNTPGVLTDDVADLAVLMLLSISRRLHHMDRYARSGDWERNIPLVMPHGLKHKVAGIFGFGRIGQAVATRLQAFGMDIRYYQPRAVNNTAVIRDVSLIELARNSDYLMICAPANEYTIQAVNAQVLDAIGPNGALVNIARGTIVDEFALITALKQGRLGAAALDVFEQEPFIPIELRELDNVILTPHIASYTIEARLAMGQLTITNLLSHFSGKALLTPSFKPNEDKINVELKKLSYFWAELPVQNKDEGLKFRQLFFQLTH